MTLCRLVKSDRRFGGACCLRLQDQAALYCLALDGLSFKVTVIGTPALVTQ